MTPDYFGLALKFTLRWEGTAFTNDPDDRGGATRYGVTQRVYAAYLKTVGRLFRSVRYISRPELEAIYRRDYWIAAGCDRIANPRLAIAHFDFAVNSGVSRAVTFLQSEVRDYLTIAIDGKFGPQTERLVNRCADNRFVGDYIEARELFLESIAKGKQAKYLNGWMNRVNDLRAYVATVSAYISR